MSGSSRKYWSTEELTRDAAYWRKGEAFAKEMVAKIWSRSGYESPKWIGQQNAARERARASEAEIASRAPTCPRHQRWTFTMRAPQAQVAP
ncbi:hypothetical protein BPNPMPFG_002458 [Mesorhizobium sp. AR07]|uniref:hypothetical protein n=1 Tax=Mesorhizobium sp. AR07 TaxID=2865838 RepID=UPI0021601585|nr:hypothetical protein [Mesorhizobium sp. AR07]UVK46750.1 hypothetical protein BPNPMPFG_002458 [Mesorhizobium sp. AR07]